MACPHHSYALRIATRGLANRTPPRLKRSCNVRQGAVDNYGTAGPQLAEERDGAPRPALAHFG
jgi:hypothetical protein